MSYLLTMASRTAGNVKGALGEATVLAELLRTGSAVNALTGDDTGWDLHMHIPTAPIGSRKKWQLSGLVVHVQVKARQRGLSVRVGESTVAGWLAGSRSGTPTFLILVSGSGEAARSYRVDPHEMLHLGEPDTRGDVLLTAHRNAPFDHLTFAYLADLWAHHGLLMMTIGEDVERLVRASDSSDYRAHLLNIVGLLAAPAVPLLEPMDNGGSLLSAGASIFPALLPSLDPENLFDAASGQDDVYQELLQAAGSYHGAWSDTIVKAWMISPSATWEGFAEDMKSAAKRISEYAAACRMIRPWPNVVLGPAVAHRAVARAFR
ncbi:hypothetical protein KIV56_11590 [Cryobacterium breve]|uniref:DUF4365 domain-containing protein n=1 Tax=Cryobacterium breve TaxID=1259258 RepID=A0ABY7NC43_9MICO|nr:hypothetical protein [Cryobacterium breve]WBM79133.1 hypothetical protein KIV56_11590 [Cryobacterium breve]